MAVISNLQGCMSEGSHWQQQSLMAPLPMESTETRAGLIITLAKTEQKKVIKKIPHTGDKESLDQCG